MKDTFSLSMQPPAATPQQRSATPAPAAAGMLGQPPANLVKDTTTAAFTADVIQESRRQPVLVDFWAPWCGPCKQLTPILEKAVQAAGGRVKLVKMNIDEHPTIPGQLGIQSIPAVIAFKNGQPVDGFMGALPESQVTAFITRVVGKNGAAPQLADALAAAAEARSLGDVQTAADIYAAIREQEPGNAEAAAGLADLLFEAGDLDGAEAVLAELPDDKRAAPAVAAILARIELERQAAAVGDSAELERRLARDPGDHQARFDLAMVQNARGQRAEAAENLLAIMKADRSWNEDGAKAQLLRFFEAWGMSDPATLSARRRLSSLLFS